MSIRDISLSVYKRTVYPVHTYDLCLRVKLYIDVRKCNIRAMKTWSCILIPKKCV